MAGAVQSPDRLVSALLASGRSHRDAGLFLTEAQSILSRAAASSNAAAAATIKPPRAAAAAKAKAQYNAKAWWDTPPSSADEERVRKIEAIFAGADTDNSKVILLDEFVRELSTASGESIWGVFTPNDAETLFREIDVTKTCARRRLRASCPRAHSDAPLPRVPRAAAAR